MGRVNCCQPITSKVLQSWQKVRLLATDVDGTLTTQQQFPSTMVQSLERLAEAGIAVLLVTGRSAGWVQGLAHYLPVLGAIAENGGVFYHKDSDVAKVLSPIPNLAQHRQQLASTFHTLQSQYPNLQESTDNDFRLTDWTFDVNQIRYTDLQTLAEICAQQGWGFTYSTVQCHIKPLKQDKATGLQQVLSQHLSTLGSTLQLETVITMGDSPNDESLFNPALFPQSVGVANILDYAQTLTDLPAYVTVNREAAGFCEFVQGLLQS
ncbi:MAG: HAD-IIB family hydrolase [Microcoleaceae cyanobacterium]